MYEFPIGGVTNPTNLVAQNNLLDEKSENGSYRAKVKALTGKHGREYSPCLLQFPKFGHVPWLLAS